MELSSSTTIKGKKCRKGRQRRNKKETKIDCIRCSIIFGAFYTPPPRSASRLLNISLSLSLCPTLTLSSCFCYPLSLSLSPCFSPVRFVEFKMLRFSHSATGENNTLPKKQTHIQRDVTLAPHNERAINSSFYFLTVGPLSHSLSPSASVCVSALVYV